MGKKGIPNGEAECVNVGNMKHHVCRENHWPSGSYYQDTKSKGRYSGGEAGR